jgi:hypothetical protein
MYLMSRRARINSGAGVEWATTILGRVKEVTGNDVGLWANAYSPGFGTVTWTSWWADLGSMEAAFAKLQADTRYNALGAAGASLIDGAVDDGLFQTVSGDPSDDPATVQYVASVQAVCAAGGIVRAMTAGVEIAEKVTAIGGANTIFVRSLTGPYGQIGWLTRYGSLAEVGDAQDKLAADGGWLNYLDGTKGCFVEDPSVTVTTLYQKIG